VIQYLSCVIEEGIEFMEQYWGFVVFAGVAAYFVYLVYKNGGFKNALFGARKEAEIGKVDGLPRFGVTSSIRVHKMRDTNADENIVGIELVQKTGLSYRMQPFSLRISDARELARLLEAAAGNYT